MSRIELEDSESEEISTVEFMDSEDSDDLDIDHILDYEDKCDAIESALEELGLHQLLDADGNPYGSRGRYYLDQPMIITVDQTEDSLVRIELHLFVREWEDENFDFDHFYNLVSNKCYTSLHRTTDESIEFRMIVPEVPMEMFPTLIKATIERNMKTIEYFRKLHRSYRMLYC